MSEQQLPEGWQMLRFGDIAHHISKRVEPSETDLKIYVGLEHLDPDSLKIKRHGVPSDVDGQKLLVKKGQIIFGKRRAYQRKVAVADWDCICSAHAMVLEANPKKVLSEFLPFFMQSDVFMNRAVAISEGSLSPTIKWKVLESQRFRIPSLLEQRKILSLLQSANLFEQKQSEALRSCLSLKQSLMGSFFIKSAQNENWPKFKIGDVCESLVPGRNKPKVFDGNIPWVTTPDILGLYLPAKQHALYLSEDEIKRSGGKIVPKGAVIMSCVGELGRVAIATSEIVLNQQLHAFICPDDVIPEFLAYSLTMQTRYMHSIASQTTIPYLNKSNCESIPFFKPSLSRQKEIVSTLQFIDQIIDSFEKNPSLERLLNKINIAE